MVAFNILWQNRRQFVGHSVQQSRPELLPLTMGFELHA